MNPQQNLTNAQFQILKAASDKFCATFAAHQANPRDFDALNASDKATSEFMAVVNNDELIIIASLLAAMEENKAQIAKLEARTVAPLNFSEGADADYCRQWVWGQIKGSAWKAEKILRQACFLYKLLSTERNERYFPCPSLRFVRQT